MSVTSIRLNDDVEGPLEKLAQKLDRSKNYLVNQAIREFVYRQAMDGARCANTLEGLNSAKEGHLVGEEAVNTEAHRVDAGYFKRWTGERFL